MSRWQKYKQSGEVSNKAKPANTRRDGGKSMDM
jgi:hypothetical protein